MTPQHPAGFRDAACIPAIPLGANSRLFDGSAKPAGSIGEDKKTLSATSAKASSYGKGPFSLADRCSCWFLAAAR